MRSRWNIGRMDGKLRAALPWCVSKTSAKPSSLSKKPRARISQSLKSPARINGAASGTIARTRATIMASWRFRPRSVKPRWTLMQCTGTHLLGWAAPIALAQSCMHRWFGGPPIITGSPDDQPLPKWINAFLERLTYAEWWLSAHVFGVPFGVSYILTARKPDSSGRHRTCRGSD